MRALRRALLRWYDAHRRDLPWREHGGFYEVWLSEVMLQQTRAAAVVPYYKRFLARYPDISSLAVASEADLLAAWSGLGYYSRARNLHRAAKHILQHGEPGTWEQVVALPGVGPYTAAAVASISLGLPYAAVDGNVIRVISRLANDPSDISSSAARSAFAARAQALLDARRPGDFNQAMMELGATVCVPRIPGCGACPLAGFCAAREAGVERQLPIRRPKPAAREIRVDLLLIERGGRVFLVRRPADAKRLAGFWELPERGKMRGCGKCSEFCQFRHRIVNDVFGITVWRPAATKSPSKLPDGAWFARDELSRMPVSTITRKALRNWRTE